jgi:hypothetical protein
MKIAQPLRTAVAVAGLVAARAAQADSGGISSSGWYSMLGIVGIGVVLFWVYKKIG